MVGSSIPVVDWFLATGDLRSETVLCPELLPAIPKSNWFLATGVSKSEAVLCPGLLPAVNTKLLDLDCGRSSCGGWLGDLSGVLVELSAAREGFSL
jgi:hypothetical protein